MVLYYMKLRDYQNEAIQSIFDYFESGNCGNPVVAMPTGTGKSVVIAGFINRVLKMWPGQRFLVATHVKELIEQNHNKLKAVWQEAPTGIYSAGLNQKDIIQPVIFGGSASVVNCVEAFGHRDLIIVDEAHLVSPKDDTTYQNIIKRLKVINPYLKVVGLTATPFRLGQGMITDEGLFTDICFDITGIDAFNRLIAEGYLAPLIPKRTNIEIDVSNVGINNGDYNKGQLDEETDKVLYEGIKELIQFGHDRRSWLTFTSGVKSTEHAAEMLNSFGIDALPVHSKITRRECDIRIKAFQTGQVRCLVNANMLTTGFDHPPVDLIGMFRPTLSPGLWVQMLGRGTRPYDWTKPHLYIPGFEFVKQNCLVLDFAKNTRRLGPINNPIIPRKKGNRAGDAPVRICEKCGVYNHASARVCCYCGFEFKFKNKLSTEAGTEELLASDLPVVEYFNVDRVVYNKHIKKGGMSATLKAVYYCGLRQFTEYVALESTIGYTKHKAREWWRQRHTIEPPNTIDEALSYVSQLRPPKKLRVWLNKTYPEVLGYEF